MSFTFYFRSLSVTICTVVLDKLQNSLIYEFIKTLLTQENGSVGACAGAVLMNSGLHNTACFLERSEENVITSLVIKTGQRR